MKKIINHEKYGEICYSESEWTSKKRLSINGNQLQKDSKNTFLWVKDGQYITVSIEGSYFKGISLVIEGEKIEVSKACKWYEIVFAFIPFVFVMVWGNVPSSVEIFPVVGGALGGAITGALGILGLTLSGKVEKWYFKILIGIGTCVVSILICYLLALGLLSL